MKEETYKHISLVKDIISSLVLISLGILGYLVSSDVRTIQKEADQRARAKKAQELWNDIYTVTQTSAEKSNALGSAIEKLITTIDELLNNYKRVYKTDTKDIVKDDPRYNAFLISFTGECLNVLTRTDAIVNEFDFLRLKYVVLAQEHRLEAWGKFFNQSEQVRAWKERISTNTKTVCSALFDGLKNNTNPNELSRQLESLASSMSRDLFDLSAPYLKGLSEFSAANLENISKTVAK